MWIDDLRLNCANVVFVLTDIGFDRQTVDRAIGDDSTHDLGAALAVDAVSRLAHDRL